jgi:hypothetical protein
MLQRRAQWIWGGRIAAILLLAGLVAYLSLVGLAKADKLASVLSLLVAVAALVVPYLLPPPGKSDSRRGPVQDVGNSVVGKHLTQVQNSGAVRVQGPPGTPNDAPSGKASAVPGGQGGQYVNGVWIGGNLTQVDGTDGDVTIG